MSPPTILAIDLSALTWWQIKSPKNEGNPAAARDGVLSKIDALARKERPDLVVICCDRGRSFRYTEYDAYKGQRGEHTPIEIEYAQSVKEAAAARWHILERDAFEGDDVICSLAAQLQDCKVTILCEDKDLLPLLAYEHVRIIHTQRGTPITAEDVEKRLGIKPAQVRDYLVLAGDTADNWKGIPGIGDGYASALLKDHGDIKGIWAAAEAGKVEPPNVRQAVLDSPGIIELGIKVCTMVHDLPGIRDEVMAALSEAQKGTSEAPAPAKATNAAPAPAEARGDTAERKEKPPADKVAPAAAPADGTGQRAVRTGQVPTEVPTGWSNPCNMIAAALAKAQGAIIPPPKNRTAKVKGVAKGSGREYEYTYKYSDLAAIVEAMRVPLSSNNIAVVQSETADKKQIRTMLVHSSGQWVVSECCIVMGDEKNDLKGAQAHGSALTYTKRHALCLALGIAAEDDDDGKGASDE